MIRVKWLTLLLLLTLVMGCGVAPKDGSAGKTVGADSTGSVGGGPVTRPDTPVSVYKPVDPQLLQYDAEDLAAAAHVAHVTMRQGVKLPSHARPLYGDREEDRPKIAHILRLIRLATVAERPEGSREVLNDQPDLMLTVQYADGRLVQVGLAYRRLDTGAYQNIQGRMFIPEIGEVIAPELDQFYRGVARVGRTNLLVPVALLDVEPKPVHPGGPVTVRGEGWVGVTRISVLLSDTGTNQLLGEVPVERGAFTWQGTLPANLTPVPRWQARYAIAIQADGVPSYQIPLEVSAP